MKNSTCIDSASHNKGLSPCPAFGGAEGTVPETRMMMYKRFAVAFSYPEGDFFVFFPEQKKAKAELPLEYDRLFRQGEIWLYGVEYSAENEFQRARALADISGFYKAFGLEPDKDRPDALVTELEFMHYLIYKERNAPDREKAILCFSAQQKFFSEHLLPAAKKITEAIIVQSKDSFYREITQEMLSFLESEEKILSRQAK